MTKKEKIEEIFMKEVVLNKKDHIISVEEAKEDKWYVLVSRTLESVYIAFRFRDHWIFHHIYKPNYWYRESDSLIHLLSNSLSKSENKIYQFNSFKEASEFANNVNFKQDK